MLKPGSRTSAYYDAQDRLLAFGNTQYTYTANGELRTKTDSSGTTTYTYDAMGSLLRVELPNGKLVEYIVDAEGRRIAKKVNGATERKWLYRDSLKPIAELDASGNVTAVYGYAEKYTTPSFVERDGQRYRVISDHLGSSRLVVNAADSADRPVVGEYAAFGEVSGNGIGWMPFGFAGGIYDVDTGLVRFGARDYDPVVGRWTAKDPSLSNGSGLNFYGYVDNEPINWIDISGEIKLPADFQTLPPEWVVDPTHRDPNGIRFRHPSGDVLDFHRGRAGKPGWRGRDHWHRNGGREHLPPGSEIPDPEAVCRDQNRTLDAPGFEEAMSDDESKNVPFRGMLLGPFQTSYRGPEFPVFVPIPLPIRIPVPIPL